MPCSNNQEFMKSVKVQKKEIPQSKMLELNMPTGTQNLNDCVKGLFQSWGWKQTCGIEENVNENFHRTNLPVSHFLSMSCVCPPLHLRWIDFGYLPIISQRLLTWKCYVDDKNQA